MVVETDTSDYALATILSIYTPDGEIHPFTFHLRSFNPTELNYDTHDKELLAIFEAFKHWHQYLEGSTIPIDVVMDHKNLEYFATTSCLPAARRDGLSISPSSIWLSASIPGSWARNLMH